MQKHFVLATTTLNQVSLRPSGYKRLLVSFTVQNIFAFPLARSVSVQLCQPIGN